MMPLDVDFGDSWAGMYKQIYTNNLISYLKIYITFTFRNYRKAQYCVNTVPEKTPDEGRYCEYQQEPPYQQTCYCRTDLCNGDY